MRDRVSGLRDAWDELPDIHRVLLLTAMALSAIVVVAYALIRHPNALGGDQAEYDVQGRFFDQGKLWWSTVVLGEPHATAWKSPLYPAWVGLWYSILGPGATKVAIVQGLSLAPVTVLLTWLLARRWFDLTTAALAAFVVALFPLSWEFFGLLYSEALAVPLTLLVIYLVFARPPPSWATVAGVGALMGVCVLVRPTSFFLFAAIAAAWIIATGLWAGLGRTIVAGVCAVLIVAPWTVRNAIVLDGFVPVSIQDAAAYGTFNEEAANDPVYPYAWRPTPGNIVAELERDPPDSEVEFRTVLQDRARDYLSDHPEAVAHAFFWNGLSRFWDIRRPARALDETRFDGRSRAVTTAGLAAYYVLLLLALATLWRLRRRTELLIPFLALALAASVVFTIQAGTRYRAPLEPVIVVLACATIAPLLARRSDPAQRQDSYNAA